MVGALRCVGQAVHLTARSFASNEAIALLFMFDLSRKSTLASVKEWYRQARGYNKTAIPFLIGTKYDAFVGLPGAEQRAIAKQARKFARAMRVSASAGAADDLCATDTIINH